MRKKSHLALANYLMNSNGMEILMNYKRSFYWGSILPDCVPSFITTRHCMEDTFLHLKKQRHQLLQHYDPIKGITSSFCRHLGVILHYVADYFTFPHNAFYNGNIKEHCQYEKVLKHRLRSYVGAVEHKRKRAENSSFYTVESICHFIQQEHANYTNSVHNVDNDCTFIVAVCHQIVDSVLHMAERATFMASHKLELAK